MSISEHDLPAYVDGGLPEERVSTWNMRSAKARIAGGVF
jgi:hypothetical protein